MSLRLVPKLVTLNDLERRNGRYFALFQRIRVASGALRKSSRSLSHLLMSSCLHPLKAASITFCCRLFQTSTRRSFSSSTLFIQHSYTLCCTTPQTLQSTRFRAGLFGDQRSGPIKFGISCCSCLMVSLHGEMERCLVERQTYRLQYA